jgi:hypothetical protein
MSRATKPFRFLLSALGLSACNAVLGPDEVELRVRNQSAAEFDSVTIQFPGATLRYGRLLAGGASAYLEADGAYRYGYVEVWSGNSKFVLQPVDYVGEETLRPGRYTYELGLSGESLTLTLSEDTQETDGLIFLRQNVEPEVVMEALFVGLVAPDGAGCMRLEHPDGHTVIWPHGSRLVWRNGVPWVREGPDGRYLGYIGGNFRLGGGEVEELHTGLSISAADRELAAGNCPGRYWIVGEVP